MLQKWPTNELFPYSPKTALLIFSSWCAIKSRQGERKIGEREASRI